VQKEIGKRIEKAALRKYACSSLAGKRSLFSY
jgi:hypothetical protein